MTDPTGQHPAPLDYERAGSQEQQRPARPSSPVRALVEFIVCGAIEIVILLTVVWLAFSVGAYLLSKLDR